MKRRSTDRRSAPSDAALVSTKANGGSWRPFSEADIALVSGSAIQILTQIGLSDAPASARDIILAAGGSFSDGRLRYSEDLVREAIETGPSSVVLAGQVEANDLVVGGTNSFTGTGGAAPNILDTDSGKYRPSTLADLRDAARLADALSHVHFFARSLVARDIFDPRSLDLETTLASLAGTTKHVMVQAAHPDHVRPIAEICYRIAGSEDAFRARPFLSLNVNHVVPPLRFHPEAAEVLIEGARYGIPVHCNVFGQLGASSPVTVAGSVSQTLAETLAGIALVHAVDADAARIAGPRPMITDLRTGGMAGGAGEQVQANTLALQVLGSWNMPCSIIAGATDSKLPDAQAGYEKALSVGAAIQAGANLVTQAIGSQASLMGVSFAAMVIDNDLAGALLRANVLPEVTAETVSLNAISEVVEGEGHFLGHADTYQRMKSDFLYPQIADRQMLEAWLQGDQQGLVSVASERAKQILNTHRPDHISPELMAELRGISGLPEEPE